MKKAAICIHHRVSCSLGRSVAAIALALVACGAVLPSARADLVTAFNFNTGTTTIGNAASAATLMSTSGQSSTITPTGFVGASDVVVFGGSTVNAYNGDAAGVALALKGGSGAGSTGTGGNNGGYIVFSIASTNLMNLDVSYATETSGTTTGFTTQTLSYSTDGSNFTTFGSKTPTTSFTKADFDLSSITAIDNQSTVYFELAFTGATTASGNNRIDNLQVNTVPEPTTVLGGLLLLGTAAWSQRRRLSGLTGLAA